MSAESLLFIALFVKGSSTIPKTPKAGGGGTPNRGGKIRGFAQRAKNFGQGVKNAASQGKNMSGGAAKRAAKGAAIGGLKGFASGGIGGGMAGALKGGLSGLKPGGKPGGGDTGKPQGALGALKGKLGGGKQDASKIPNQDLRASKEGNRGFLPQPKIPGLKKAQKKIPQKDLRDPSATRELSNMKQKYDALNEKKDELVRKVGAQVAEKMGGIPAPIAEKLIAIAQVYEKYKNRIMLILFLGIFLLLFLLFDSSTFDVPQQDNGQAGTPTTSDICKPAQLSNGQAKGSTVVCTITVTYTGSAQDISIVDTIMPGSEHVSETSKGVFDPTANTVTWDAKNDGLQLNPVNITVSVVLHITTATPDTIVYNAYEINPTGLSAGSGGGASCTATGSPDMEAKWKQVLQIGQQYGPVWIAFLNDARSIAQKEDYPIAVIVGQGALESAHGTSNFARTRNNYFGFMAYDNNLNATKTYPNAAASIEDYVKLIKGGNGGSNKLYLQAYANRSDPVKMVQLIKAGGYATDPNYVSSVTNIAEFKILVGVKLPCN